MPALLQVVMRGWPFRPGLSRRLDHRATLDPTRRRGRLLDRSTRLRVRCPRLVRKLGKTLACASSREHSSPPGVSLL